MLKTAGGNSLPVNKKGQGIRFSTAHQPGQGIFTGLTSSTSAAVSKGRYHRNSFQGIEGNQGPYKLKGTNSEIYIIVLAGSERVYADGKLLARGVDRDYTIDYNLAEINFTSAMPVTKDRRIVVEFEYSDRNYTRFMVSGSTGMSTEKGNYFFNVFSEHDARNQPLMQELRDHEKQLLSALGDSLHRAWVPKIDSVEFRDDIVLYRLSDSIVDGISYLVYKHSNDPASAHYRLGFSYVGENRGNYTQVSSAANGRVFKWSAPLNGTPSGNYEPVTMLVAPGKQQVISMGGNSFISQRSEASFEIALSNLDRNTFSRIDNDDNSGLAFRVGLDSNIPLKYEGQLLSGGIDYEFSGRNFFTTGRFRPVEYERDWNLQGMSESREEHKLSWHTGYIREDGGGFANYSGEFLRISENYSGLRNSLQAGTSLAGFGGKGVVSYLNSGSNFSGTEFLRHMAEVSRPLWFFRIGIRSEGENNKIENGGILSASSGAFYQKEVFAENSDTARFHFHTAYRERDDKLPLEGRLASSSFSREFSSGFRTRSAAGNDFSGVFHHRSLAPDSNARGYIPPENSINGRLDARFGLLKGIIQNTGMYETGSGLEVKRDFMYIEVPRGQGTHTWTDYNDNAIKELDEFEHARYPDQANYIRIFIPSDDFIRTRSNQFSQSIRLNPPVAWKKKAGVTKFLSFFSGQTAYRTGQKTSHANLASGMNPFHSSLSDTTLINLSSSLRNTILFQPPDRFALEYLHQEDKSKYLLVNGFDTRHTSAHTINGRYNYNRSVIFSNLLETRKKIYNSGFSPQKDFDIDMISRRLAVSVQPGYSLQASIHIKWTSLHNNPGGEKADRHNIGTEVSYTIPMKGNIIVRTDYYYIDYNAAVNTPVAWEMLEGMKPGNNMTLMLQFQQNLTGSLQLSLNYHGRTSQGERFIHNGGMQMRAFF
jgi:hypothetical protein